MLTEREERLYISQHRFLECLELGSDETAHRIMGHFIKCLEIYKKRSQRRKDSWERYGWLDSLFHMRDKSGRLQIEFWEFYDPDNPPEDLEDAYDLINYTWFFIMNVEDRNERGHG